MAGLVGVALLAGCGDDGGTSASGSSGADLPAEYTTVPTEIGITEQITEDIPTGLEVVFVSASVPPVPFYLAGMEEAADILGWKVSNITIDQTNPASISSSIDSAIAQKPDAIALVALENAQFAPQLENAREAGVPLIGVATAEDTAEGLYQIARTTSRAEYGTEMLVAAILDDAEKAGQDAKVVQLTVPAVASVFKPKDEGVPAALSEECEECTHELLDLELADVFSGEYTQTVVSYLQKHPDTNYIVADQGALAAGLSAALAQAGLNSVKIYGFDAQAVNLDELKAGKPGAWTATNYNYDGFMMMDLIARVKVGQATDVWDDEHMTYLVTAENADEIDSEDPEFPADYQEQFKALWNK